LPNLRSLLQCCDAIDYFLLRRKLPLTLSLDLRLTCDLCLAFSSRLFGSCNLALFLGLMYLGKTALKFLLKVAIQLLS